MTAPASDTTLQASKPPAWSDKDLAMNPHDAADKARRVEAMFDAIAPSYDLNNRVHSLWMDQSWRRAAVKQANVKPTDTVLDVACGTGDLSLAFLRGGAARVVGIDFTVNMLRFASIKQKRADLAEKAVSFHAGDAMRLPVASGSVDVVSIAFGIRNVAMPQLATDEFFRVLRPGGRLIVLEFSLPTNPVVRGLYNFYFKQILPRTASLIARDRSGAYRYLPKSVNTFMDRTAMTGMIEKAGFQNVSIKPLTMGIAVVYRAVKV